MSDRVTIAIDGGVADVRLNRPDKLNALDAEMFVGLVDAGAALAADTSVRAVVLSGEGRAFCAGLDFSGFMAMAGSGQGDGLAVDREHRRPHHPPGPAVRPRAGARCRCPSSPPCTATAWAAACRSPSAPTCASSTPTPSCRCSRSAGASPPT